MFPHGGLNADLIKKSPVENVDLMAHGCKTMVLGDIQDNARVMMGGHTRQPSQRVCQLLLLLIWCQGN